MSILNKPYEIAVYEDELKNGVFVEKRLGVIGSDKMFSQNRALEPNLVRNVNGQNKFSFKMYKKYIDTITGEETENLFIDWLFSERKVKLKYGTHINESGQEVDTWYDFVIKDVVENSSNYLYTYQLEDANVQELSKNGFGVILDADLMNNIGTSKELATQALAETDWAVDGDVIVEAVDEALVYINIPAGTTAKHLLDQTVLSYGVTEENHTFSTETTALAFYSSCKNKPHRFQFIYSDKGYNKDLQGNFVIDRKDDRTINEKNCQYYIEFNTPDTNYKDEDRTEDEKNYDLYLPNGFTLATPSIRPLPEDADEDQENEQDSVVSTWYRGKRYGFSKQAKYIPLLDRYCERFTKQEAIPLDNKKVLKFVNPGVLGFSGTLNFDDPNSVSFSGQKAAAYVGLGIKLDYNLIDTYVVNYKLEVADATSLKTLGGHARSFNVISYKIYTNEEKTTEADYTYLGDNTYQLNEIPANKILWVEAKYQKIEDKDDGLPYIFIQPNRGLSDSVSFEITGLNVKIDGEYFGYVDSNYVSPALIQNHITNYKFETKSGWIATSDEATSSANRPQAENVCGRFVGNQFKTIVEDFMDGQYDENNSYTPYMKITLYGNEQFVLNSGIRDNRTTIKNMPLNEEWILDYEILDSTGNKINNFNFNLGEYTYSTVTGGYIPRTGSITINEITVPLMEKEEDINRKKFKVTSTSYNDDTFPKQSAVHLKISTTSQPSSESPLVFYIKKIALYKKSLGGDGKIIAPDYNESESQAIKDWVDKSVLEKKYYYFNSWDVDDTNPNVCIDKKTLPTKTATSLSYNEYKPVYNTGAEKVRSVSVKESNYFNILQSIAETFEQWLVIEIERNADGSIVENGKKIKFKNYRGKNNYACFRYGLNLKDIQRTHASKNIVTKLIVKSNTNELAENGFCTIQRAGANPTGENYIYDFQYLLNMGIMKDEDYFSTNYDLDGAHGPDATLWNGEVAANTNYNLNGYFSRLKKINSAIIPVSEEMSGLQTDLVQSKAKKEVADATLAAAESGIQTTREDFRALVGVYPEEAQNGKIKQIGWPANTNGNAPSVPVTAVSRDPWVTIENKNTEGFTNGIKVNAQDSTVQVALKLADEMKPIDADIKVHQGTTYTDLGSGDLEISKSNGLQYTGIYLYTDWDEENRYVLQYELECTDGQLKNIGCHNCYFKNDDFKFSITNSSGVEIQPLSSNKDDSVFIPKTLFVKNEKYFVTIKCKRKTPTDENEKKQDDNLWIQPNRGIGDPVKCKVTNIKLFRYYNQAELVKNSDRTAHIYLTVPIILESGTALTRVYDTTCTIAAKATGAIALQNVTSVDMSRSDVQKYIQEYTTNYEKRNNSINEIETLGPQIEEVEEAIKEKEAYVKQLLEYKTQLNKLFFKRYSQFIQEGTWISEEYVDDEKYYTDAQSVLYNSCYPQVAYNINVLELSRLPGFEAFKFDLGDKTQVIDDEFFGEGKREEVIITELSEMLDMPDKNSIKVQNFKNQFQDLFQKITATVQQTQYNSGSYEKGEKFLNSGSEKQSEFITNALNGAQTYLQYGQTVESGPHGIIVTDTSDKQRQLRLAGGAILFSAEDPLTKERTWRTGLTNEGIAADLITTGRLDTGAIQIMAADEPVFRWDAHGISAYDTLVGQMGEVDTITDVNTKKFVRFDKHGVYGINYAEDVDGANWVPENIDEVDEKATFALTWEGLKVTGTSDNEGKAGVARIGRLTTTGKTPKEYIMAVQNKDGQDTFRIDANGNVEIGGALHIGPIEGKATVSVSKAIDDAAKDAKDQAINTAAQDATNKANAAQAAAEATASADASAKAAAAQAAAEATARGLAEGLQSQIDGEITSWFEKGTPISMGEESTIEVNSNPPSNSWTTQEDKIKHEGDLYYDTNTQYCFRWVREETESEPVWTWKQIADEGITEAMAAASRAQSTADGKMTVYSTINGVTPNSGDLLIPSSDINTDNDNEIEYKQGKVYKYTGISWESIAYTDDTALNDFKNNTYVNDLAGLQQQIDGKAETWYSTTDPSNAWTTDETKEKHLGDLWHYPGNTATINGVKRGKNSEWIWRKNGASYLWVEMSVPDVVFDTIDGIASIYTTIPAEPVVGDLLIPTTDSDNYKSGKVYRYDGSLWVAVNYTDETTVITKIGEIQIGSRNLLRFTSGLPIDYTLQNGIGSWSQDGLEDTGEGLKTTPNNNTNRSFHIPLAGTGIINNNESVTLSFEYRGDYTSFGAFYYIKNGGPNLSRDCSDWTITPSSEKWQKFEATFAMDHINNDVGQCTGILLFYAHSLGDGKGTWIEIKKGSLKLERGNKATDWTVAPEDLNATIDAVKTQADAKADIYYQPLDPAVYSGTGVWGSARVGDMWRCTTTSNNYTSQSSTKSATQVARKKNAEYIWTGDDTNGYGWREMEIPNNIFDAYDGKASLYVSKPENGYKARDLWILDKQSKNSSDTATYDTTYPAYDVGTLLVSIVDRPNTSDANTKYNKSDWVEQVKYTQDLDAFKQSWSQDKLTLEQAIDGRIKTSDLSVSKSIDPNTGLAVTTITLNGATTKTYTSEDGAYLLTNVGVGKNEDGSSSYFMVNTDGALQADNAIINGTIFANAGKIAGWEISQNALHTTNNSLYLGTATITAKIGTATVNNLVFKAGNNFGVTDKGQIYAASGVVGTTDVTQIASTGYVTSQASYYATTAAASYSNSAIATVDTAVKKLLKLPDTLDISSIATVTATYTISPYIAGGYLSIGTSATTNESRVIIDPNNHSGANTIFQVYNSDGELAIGLQEDGGAYFKGEIKAEKGKIGGWSLEEGRLGSEDFGLFTNSKFIDYYSEEIVQAVENTDRIITTIDHKNSTFVENTRNPIIFAGALPKSEGYLTLSVTYGPGAGSSEYGEYIYDIELGDINKMFSHTIPDTAISYSSHTVDLYAGIIYITIKYENSSFAQVSGQISFHYKGYTKTKVTTETIPTYFVAKDGYSHFTRGRMGPLQFGAEGIVLSQGTGTKYMLTPFGLEKRSAEGIAIRPWGDFF